MFFSKSHDDRLTFLLPEAKNVLLVRAIEEAQRDGDKSFKDVTASDFAESGLKAAHAWAKKPLRKNSSSPGQRTCCPLSAPKDSSRTSAPERFSFVLPGFSFSF